jgi:2-polyprenyl-3-methyl-5-hydroxy-6-metoxy-1,4-benzoquinol methylase
MTSAPEPRVAEATGVHEAHETHWAAYDAAGIQRLLAVEDRHFWFRARNHIIAALVDDPINSLPDGFRVLEVGCGSGNVLRVLKRAAGGRGRVEGLEVSGPASEVARQRTGLTVTNGKVADLRSPDPYDIIAAFDVLEHISDEAAVLSQMRALLRPDGRLILTVPAHPKLWSSFDEASEHMRRYTRSSLTRALRAAGFDIEYLTYFMFLLYGPMWLRRRISLKRSQDFGAVFDSEFQIVPGVNAVAYQVLRQDAIVIRHRRTLPIGTSLAVIARPRPR